MDIKETQRKALRLLMIFRAWRLHIKDPSYNAWENNFSLKISMATFLKNLKSGMAEERSAVRTMMYLKSRGVDESEYINFVVVGYPDPGYNMAATHDKALDAYIQWVNRDKEMVMLCFDHFTMHQSMVPWIMNHVKINDSTNFRIHVAEALTRTNTWDKLWAMRDQSSFMFDLIWPTLHRYKPLFEGN